MRRGHLILFVKAPQLGAVKTRLGQDIGRYDAWRFYRETTRLMIRRLGVCPRWNLTLAVTPDDFAGRARFWPDAIPRFPQGHGDIGTRMTHACEAIPFGPTVLIGADIPTVTRDHIAQAFHLLTRVDLVFGPSTDGGFWLVGARRARSLRRIFKDVRWSTRHALADTLRNAEGRMTVALLEPQTDIDNGKDYRAWKASIRRAD